MRPEKEQVVADQRSETRYQICALKSGIGLTRLVNNCRLPGGTSGMPHYNHNPHATVSTKDTAATRRLYLFACLMLVW